MREAFILSAFVVGVIFFFVFVPSLIEKLDKPIQEGVVVEMNHSPFWIQTLIISNSPHFIHHQEKWTVTIEKEGKSRTVESKELYDSVSVGDYIKLGEET